MSVVGPKCKGGKADIGMDDLEEGGVGSLAEEADGLVEDEIETASLPSYEEVEK